MKPTLSVFMPNYNHGQYIGQAIEAIVSQSRPPEEYIIVDDGSTDNSVEIIESFAAKYPVIKFFRNPQNLGFHKSAQNACAMAKGDYIYGGAADDYVLPGFFEKAIAMAEKHPQAGFIAGKWAHVSQEGKELKISEVVEWQEAAFVPPNVFLREYLMKYAPMHTFSLGTIYKKSCLMEIDGFREELGFYCDTFALRAIGLKYGLCYIPEKFACWRVMPESLCHSTIKDPQKELDVLHRSVVLMQSPEFNRIFPPEYVHKWAANYHSSILYRMLQKWENQFGKPTAEFWRALSDRPVYNWILKRVLWRFDQRYRTFLKYYLQRSLERYANDCDPTIKNSPRGKGVN